MEPSQLAATLLLVCVSVTVGRYGAIPSTAPAWYRAQLKQGMAQPRINSIPEEKKIPAWLSPWPQKKSNPWPQKRSRIPFRFRFYRDGAQQLADTFEKRGNQDMKRAQDMVMGLNSVPMMGKRMFQDLCEECD